MLLHDVVLVSKSWQSPENAWDSEVYRVKGLLPSKGCRYSAMGGGVSPSLKGFSFIIQPLSLFLCLSVCLLPSVPHEGTYWDVGLGGSDVTERDLLDACFTSASQKDEVTLRPRLAITLLHRLRRLSFSLAGQQREQLSPPVMSD